MYFVIAFFTVTFVGALISARTLCGYNDISPWWKVAVFLLLWTVWAMPAVLGGLRTKDGWKGRFTIRWLSAAIFFSALPFCC